MPPHKEVVNTQQLDLELNTGLNEVRAQTTTTTSAIRNRKIMLI